eukprot:CAMPEP_0176254536 /NCGR_PEP_ID=MMETSP0121_2-20121125/36581_1 /TAXON_ID=160619 /ORGANISM="Kryptoperidinium foliaceum, Strain CCMP 1326" /LENGTH=52 /DNA_ID=CAMNT_0017594345 /DNA_START=151 /DNA_END=305 /DNA_ORIENTATION=-
MTCRPGGLRTSPVALAAALAPPAAARASPAVVGPRPLGAPPVVLALALAAVA